MSLLDEARRVASEFEYPVEDLKKGVKEFIREMGWFDILWNSRDKPITRHRPSYFFPIADFS